MNPKYLVVAMFNGKVKNHCSANTPADVLSHFRTATRALFDREPTAEEEKNGFVQVDDDEVTVQVVCLGEAGVLVEDLD